MARVFKRKDRLSAMSEINLTSLMDLVFCLLIIFMVATPLLEQSISVNLPVQSQSTVRALDPKLKPQQVTIDKQGQFYWGKDPVTLQELGEHFKALAAEPDPPVISIRHDGAGTYQPVVDVLDLMTKYHLTKLHFDTQVK